MYQAHSPRGGDGRDTDSDSWNDFSLAESDKEGHLSQRLQRSQQQHLVQQHHQNHADAAHGQVSSPRHSTSSLHATSSRGKASAAAGGGGPAVRYPAAPDLRGEPASSLGRMLPSKPEVQPRRSMETDSSPITTSTPTALRTNQQHPAASQYPHTTAAGHGFTASGPQQHPQDSHHEDYEPSFHRRPSDPRSQPSTRALKNLTTKPAVKVGDGTVQSSASPDAQLLHNSGDPPHSFDQALGRTSQHNAAAPASGRAHKDGYPSASSLEQVSSKIFDEDDQGHPQRRDSGRKRRHGGQVSPNTSPHAFADGGAVNGGVVAAEALDGENMEEQGLLPIQPGDTTVAWGQRRNQGSSRHDSLRYFQVGGRGGGEEPATGAASRDSGRGGGRSARNSELFPSATRTTQAHMQPLGAASSVPNVYEDHTCSTQFLYHHVTDGLHPPPKPAKEPYMLSVAQKSEELFTRSWGEFYAFLSIPVLFLTSFLAHTAQFIFSRFIKRPLLMLQVGSDHLLKPLLTVIHNALVQPLMVFARNIIVNIGQTLAPLSDFVACFTRLAVDLLLAFRLFEIHQHYHYHGIQGDLHGHPESAARHSRLGGQHQQGHAQPQRDIHAV